MRVPAQAGFRRSYSTSDHTLVLRVLMEQARFGKKHLFLLFIDFSKAFDSVSRAQIWDCLQGLDIPTELVNAISQLYQEVTVKINSRDTGISSTLGVIQGRSLSPTLFGLFIDRLFQVTTNSGLGVKLGDQNMGILLFADDVVLLADNPDQIRKHIHNLDSFCRETGMNINLGTSKWMCARTTSGLRALYTVWNNCNTISLDSWELRSRLFDVLIRPVLLFGVTTWGPTLSRSGWKRLEKVQKVFVQEELGVRQQTPYSILLAETGRLPLEAEALILTIQFVRRIEAQDVLRYSHIASQVSRASGWYRDVCSWSASWDIPEPRWEEGLALRKQVPYKILLAETGRLPLELEALAQAIHFNFRLRAQTDDRYSHAAFMNSRGHGWNADLVTWVRRWCLPEEEWRDERRLMINLTEAAVQKLWSDPSSRL
ncbi:hypothetical protein R1sor_010455 [Riccia sorocarpa]|uniref:Reverse transcriptase domain-containing protein n=1 Tax=Riccia sorocarpa TaxID=122646 RepID=A0ABD3I470_9MARC